MTVCSNLFTVPTIPVLPQRPYKLPCALEKQWKFGKHFQPKEKEDVKPMDISATEAKLIVPVGDIDKDDKDNPQLVSEYVNDIYQYMRDLESTYSVKAR